MLSVIIETRNDEDGLARTLASLVSGAVEGIVREVVVCDKGSSDRTHHVAEHAGCVYLVNADISEGIRRAKGDWLMFLEPGARLDGGWIEAVASHVSRMTLPARFTRSRADERPFLERVFGARRPLAEGLIISKPQASALARNAASAGAIARGLSPKRLPAEILSAPRKV